MTQKQFKPHEYQCPNCKDKIHSNYSGEYVSCQCGKCAVDETAHYIRMIGEQSIYLGEYKNEVVE